MLPLLLFSPRCVASPFVMGAVRHAITRISWRDAVSSSACTPLQRCGCGWIKQPHIQTHTHTADEHTECTRTGRQQRCRVKGRRSQRQRQSATGPVVTHPQISSSVTHSLTPTATHICNHASPTCKCSQCQCSCGLSCRRCSRLLPLVVAVRRSDHRRRGQVRAVAGRAQGDRHDQRR